MITNLLSILGVTPGSVVYLHTSYSFIKSFFNDSRILIDAILRLIGSEGTLVMPAFTWHILPLERPWKGYELFLEKRPAFDTLTSLPNIGYIPCIFWKYYHCKRSAHPIWSIAAFGKNAEYITSNQHIVSDPYGSLSSFYRLKELDVFILGLGVTLNTSSLCPIVDSEIGEVHPQEIFTKRPIAFELWHNNNWIRCKTNTLKPLSVRYIKPSVVFHLSNKTANWLNYLEKDGTLFWGYRYNDYHNNAVRIAKDCVKNNLKMPWLENIPLKMKNNI